MGTAYTGEGRIGERYEPEVPRSNESIGSLLKNFTDETRHLFRQEVALARAETAEKVSMLSRNALLIGIGGGIGLAAGIVLLLTLSRGLTVLFALFMPAWIAVWLAPLVLAAILAAVAAVLIIKGQRTIKNMSLTPEETKATLKGHKDWLKGRMRHA